MYHQHSHSNSYSSGFENLLLSNVGPVLTIGMDFIYTKNRFYAESSYPCTPWHTYLKDSADSMRKKKSIFVHCKT